MDKANLIAQQTLERVDEERQERAGLIAMIRTSQKAIERSHAQIRRLDEILSEAAAPNPK
jgi:hypothetical protein